MSYLELIQTSDGLHRKWVSTEDRWLVIVGDDQSTLSVLEVRNEDICKAMVKAASTLYPIARYEAAAPVTRVLAVGQYSMNSKAGRSKFAAAYKRQTLAQAAAEGIAIKDRAELRVFAEQQSQTLHRDIKVRGELVRIIKAGLPG